jgi:hypothetical protein
MSWPSYGLLKRNRLRFVHDNGLIYITSDIIFEPVSVEDDISGNKYAREGSYRVLVE